MQSVATALPAALAALDAAVSTIRPRAAIPATLSAVVAPALWAPVHCAAFSCLAAGCSDDQLWLAGSCHSDRRRHPYRNLAAVSPLRHE